MRKDLGKNYAPEVQKENQRHVIKEHSCKYPGCQRTFVGPAQRDFCSFHQGLLHKKAVEKFNKEHPDYYKVRWIKSRGKDKKPRKPYMKSEEIKRGKVPTDYTAKQLRELSGSRLVDVANRIIEAGRVCR